MIVVIVVLGILVATALPKYLNVTKSACIAALSGLAAGINGAMSIVDAKAKLQSLTTAGNVSDGNGVNIAVDKGLTSGMLFPTAAAGSIDKTIVVSSSSTNGGSSSIPVGFAAPQFTAGSSTNAAVAKFMLQPSDASSAMLSCRVDYAGPSAGSADAIVTIGC